MPMDDNMRRELIRVAVEEEARFDYKELSELINKNHSYVQQYVKRSVPQRMRVEDWEIINTAIADENVRTRPIVDEPDLRLVPEFDFKPGMGGGAIAHNQEPARYYPIPLTDLIKYNLENADLISVVLEGDSMSPKLESQDRALINRKDRNPIAGGIFCASLSDAIVVKRISVVDPGADPVMYWIKSDNPLESDFQHLAEETHIIGRVVWYARRI